MKKSTTKRESATSFGFTMQPGASSYPIAYADKIWDIAVAGSELKAMMSGTEGQYGQEEINERVAAIVNAVRGILYEEDGETPKSLGKTYTPGTGIEISKQGEISVAKAGVNLGGIKTQLAPSYAGGKTDIPVVVEPDGTANVEVPTATSRQDGLIPSASFAKLLDLPDNTGLTASFGAKLDKTVVTTASEASTTATSVHAKGNYFIMDGTLYRATAAIVVGNPIVTDSAAQGYNATATTIAGEIGNIAIALDIIIGN